MGYDNVSFFYDALARLVFGRQQLRAQEFLIPYIPPGSNILIVGGGSGWILEAITRLHPSGLSITYIDASGKMIALAQQKNVAGNAVTFITSIIENTELDNSTFDVVLTPFLFDNFTEPTSKLAFSVIHKALKNDGLWLYCDFNQPTKWWQHILLKSMYRFFGVAAGIEATQLPDMEARFTRNDYKTLAQHDFMDGFIIAFVKTRYTA